MNVLVIDNYDSFTYNLVHFLGEIMGGVRPSVHRNDKITVEAVRALDPDAIVISPGPCTPNEAGICLDLITAVGAEIPIFGVCLGHQAIGQAYGGKVVRAPRPHARQGQRNPPHRAWRLPRHQRRLPGDALPLADHRAGLLPDAMEQTATADDGVIMGAMHVTHPVHGVQFHPESIASEHGHLILKNFLDIAGSWNDRHRQRARSPEQWPTSKQPSARSPPASSYSRREATEAFGVIMSGEATPVQIGAFLTALRLRGETIDEIAGAVTTMRAKMTRVDAPRRRHRRGRHRRRRLRQPQHLDHLGLRGRRCRRAGRQARQPGALLALRRRRHAGGAGRQDRHRPGGDLALHPRSRHRLHVRSRPPLGHEARRPGARRTRLPHGLQPDRAALQPGKRQALPARRVRARMGRAARHGPRRTGRRARLGRPRSRRPRRDFARRRDAGRLARQGQGSPRSPSRRKTPG